jgi:hypothetical protein
MQDTSFAFQYFRFSPQARTLQNSNSLDSSQLSLNELTIEHKKAPGSGALSVTQWSNNTKGSEIAPTAQIELATSLVN